MKRIWISFVILVLLICICTLGAKASETQTGQTLSAIEELKSAVKNGEEERALSLCDSLLKGWEKSHRILCTYMSHNRLEAIDDTISTLPALLAGGEVTQFNAECDRAAAQLRQLTVTERFSLENLL